jgi:hypothetical protein
MSRDVEFTALSRTGVPLVNNSFDGMFVFSLMEGQLSVRFPLDNIKFIVYFTFKDEAV